MKILITGVRGQLGRDLVLFSKTSPYRPNSHYAASKASADHLVRAYHHTYGLPVLTTNCSNSYGSYQFPEKLIPLVLLNALEGKPIPVYGNDSISVIGYMSRIIAQPSKGCSKKWMAVVRAGLSKIMCRIKK